MNNRDELEVMLCEDGGGGIERQPFANDNIQLVYKDTCEEQIRFAVEAGIERFAIFLEPGITKVIPKKPVALKTELQLVIDNHKDIETCINTRQGKLLIKTKKGGVAQQISKINSILGVQVSAKVHTDNITSKFLIYDIPCEIPLIEVCREIEGNNLTVQSIRRFKKKNKDLSESLLVTTYGTVIPNEIKIFLSVVRPRRFYDSVRQCNNCYKFTHATAKCKITPICKKCGDDKHDENKCEEINPKCINCTGAHFADDQICPSRAEEKEFLKYKCDNNLTFSEARRQRNQNKKDKSYSQVVESAQNQNNQGLTEGRIESILKNTVSEVSEKLEKTLLEVIQKQEERITNSIGKKFIEIIQKQQITIQNQEERINKLEEKLLKCEELLTRSLQQNLGNNSVSAELPPSPKRQKNSASSQEKNKKSLEQRTEQIDVTSQIPVKNPIFALNISERTKIKSRKPK